jgi:ubiquitin C-terminal hydrolase
VNTCLQAVFRIPEVQQRYDSVTFVPDNEIDSGLHKIWRSRGDDGLRELFDSVRTATMPAGQGIGDAHELFQYLCDKLKFLDELCRFKIADSITCKSCGNKDVKEDSVCEFSISTDKRNTPLTTAISETVTPHEIDSWKCEKCNKHGCKKQQLIGSFPKVMVLHMIPTHGSIDYSSVLVLNGKQYALIAVSCFNGGHWWGYGRNMPPGSPWYTLNDTHVGEHGPKQFPVAHNMRLLIYYRLD